MEQHSPPLPVKFVVRAAACLRTVSRFARDNSLQKLGTPGGIVARGTGG